MGSGVGNNITSTIRGQMKVYAARDYIDVTRRVDNYVQVNVPEYLPTTPQDDSYTNIVVQSGYFMNTNYPVTQDIIKSVHYLTLPIMHGTFAPVRFKKGAEFMLYYPTGKVEEGYLVFLNDKKEEEEKTGGSNQNAG